MTDSELLALVRAEATKFGRCCDLYQDGLGTFADHECQQRTFAMLRSVQSVLGVGKDCGPLTDEEVAAARKEAVLRNAAGDLRDALTLILPMAKGYAAANPVGSNSAHIESAEAAIAKSAA